MKRNVGVLDGCPACMTTTVKKRGVVLAETPSTPTNGGSWQ
jgi:hypothetical protein